MKRLLTSAAMFLCSLLTFAQFSGSGSGTENDPYLILNPIQLNQLRNFLNKSGVYFKLMADIDLTEFLDDENPSQGWQPVGNSSSAAFKGFIDGNGKKVTGLWIKRNNSDFIGLFGYTTGATIKNLTIEASTIIGNNNVSIVSGYSDNTTIKGCSISGNIQGASYLGSYIGSSGDKTTISGCSASGNIQGVSSIGGYVGSSGDNMVLSNGYANVSIVASGDYIGGFVGKNGATDNFTISNCKLDGTIIKGVNYVGGCCGAIVSSNYKSNSITNCIIHSDITGKNYIGGICGYSNNTGHTVNLNGCGYVGTIIGNTYIGGLIGYIKKKYTNNDIDNVQKSFAIGKIIATGNEVGGLVGRDEGYASFHFVNNISSCYFCGSIVGNANVGGIVGNKTYGETSKCYAIGSVSGTKNVGGLIGYNKGSTTIKTSVAINTRVTATEGTVGRIVGLNEGTIGKQGSSDENKSYNRTIVISKGVAQEINDGLLNGTGVSATTLKLKATYVAMGWDFTNTWNIQETECYPYMQTQTAPPVITSQVVSGATTVSGKCIDGGTITLEIDGVKKQLISSGNTLSFTVDPLQAGHEVRVSAKAEGKEQSYYTTEVVSFLGKGTEADPYQIYTAADLTQVYRKGYYKLMNDIDLTSYINQYSPTEGWQSIGREGSETIHFDGNGHKITGLWCNSTRDNTGLFSCFANGYIKNLTVETANGKQVKGGNYTGIIIGKLINGEMTNCKVIGSLADGTPVGGLMGKLDGGKVSRCQADVTINVTGENSYIGGLIGEVNGEVDQCLSYGTLTATGNTSYVGGLIGISNSGSSIANSYSSAVTNSSLSAAGIVAYNYGVVDKCYATGNVFSKNYGAGVVGYNDGEGAIVKNCVAMNNKLDVTFESQSAQSGGYGQRIIGGIKNNAPAPEMNNYALKTMQVSVNNVPQKVYDDIMNGTAKTAAQLKAKATYEELGWDFNSIWKIEEGTTYPYQTEVIAAADPDDPENPDQPDNPDNPETISVTDISKLSNAIYVLAASSQSNSETSLTICLKNAQAATAYSFDLQLPEGVSLATNSNGDYQCTLSNRHNGHGETINYQEGSGVYSFAVLSIQSKQINGNDGAILTLSLKVADNVANGDYAIKILNAKYSIESGSAKVNMPETTSKLTVSQYKKGDVNNDGDVDIADAVCIVNHVVGIATPSFVIQAADANGDGDVDIADAVRIVNYVVGKIQVLSRGNNIKTRGALLGSSVSTDAIIVDDLSLFTGSVGELTISLKNSQTTNAYSFDFVLPEGVSIVQDEDGEFQEGVSFNLSERHNSHMPVLNYLGNNTYSFAILSLQSKNLTGNEGAICTFKLKVDEAAEGGKYPVTIQNAKYSLPSGASKVPLSDTEGQLTVKLLGDANSDGKINETDRNYIVRHIMGDTPDDFDEEAANLNGDEKIDVADIVLLNQLLGENPSSLP